MKAIELILLIPLLGSLPSCTYSISMVHTEGVATDVIDQTQDASPNVSPDIEVDLPGALG